MKRLLKISISVVILSITTADVIVAQIREVVIPGLLRRMESGIDRGMIKRAPEIGDNKMARRAPEKIDDGIFYPRRIVRHYNRPVRPAFKK